MSDFKPPLHNAFVSGCGKLLLPYYLNKQKLEVHATAHCLNMIRQLDGNHALILANHSDKEDPAVAFALSYLSGEDFHYLAARELFDQEHGFRGWFMQNCGTYSVIRGEPEDLESKEMTISLIAGGTRKLFMFPEGDVTGRDDEILPLRKDGLQNMFEAQRRLLMGGKILPVYLLPLAIYYEVTIEGSVELNNCLAALEKRLNLHLDDFSMEARIRKVLAFFIEHLEAYYGINIKARKSLSLEERLLSICRHITLFVADYAGIVPPVRPSEAFLLYDVRRDLHHLSMLHKTSSCTYCKQLKTDHKERAKQCLPYLDQAQQLLIIASTINRQPFSLETAWRLVDRLEQQMLGISSAKGRRMVWIEAAEIIDLLEMWGEYRQDSEQAIKRLDYRLRTALQISLQQLKRIPRVNDAVA